MCEMNQSGVMTLCEGDCPHKRRMGINPLDNPWNNPHHPGHSGIAVQEAWHSTQGGTLPATHAVYPNAGPPHSREPYQPEGEVPDPLDPHQAHSWPLQVAQIVKQLERVAGILMRHEERFWQSRAIQYSATATQNAGDTLLDVTGRSQLNLGFFAKTLFIDNPSTYTLVHPASGRLIPPSTFGYAVPCWHAVQHLEIKVFSGASSAATIIVEACEVPFEMVV